MTGAQHRARDSWLQIGMLEITPGMLASIRQPDWQRHLDVKRPTLSCDFRRVVRSQSVVWRQPVKPDYFRVAEHAGVVSK